MLKKLLSTLALIGVATVVAGAHAADTTAVNNPEKTVRDAMHSLLPMTQIDRVVKSDLPGFYEVIVSGQVVYVTADGKYLLQGNLYNVPQKKDLTAARLAVLREQAVQQLPASKMIVFAPAHPKHTVTVFTDVDCPYCRQFHKQIAEYNKAGIAVNYVLLPLDQIHPGADKKAEAVWCSKDRNAAYTAAMNGQDPGNDTSCANPVAETKALGTSLGINATPTVLAEDGSQVDLGKANSPTLLAAELDRLLPPRAKLALRRSPRAEAAAKRRHRAGLLKYAFLTERAAALAMIVLDGLPALSPFRLERLNRDLNHVLPRTRLSAAWYVYFVATTADGIAPDSARLCEVLRAGPAAPKPATLWVVPRLGTISPWSRRLPTSCMVAASRCDRVERGSGVPHRQRADTRSAPGSG